MHDHALLTDTVPCPGGCGDTWPRTCVEDPRPGDFCWGCWERRLHGPDRESYRLARLVAGTVEEASVEPAPGIITLVLPWAVLASSNLRHQGRNRAHAPEYRDARDNAATLVSALYTGAPITEPVRVSATFHPPDFRRRDCPNLLKALHDSLQLGGVVEDDWLIQAWEGCRGEVDAEDPRVEVSVVVLDVEKMPETTEAV